MVTVGLRELGQNASQVLKQVQDGENVVVTDRRRPIAKIVALQTSPLEQMKDAGLVRPALRSWREVPAVPESSEKAPAPTDILRQMRESERY